MFMYSTKTPKGYLKYSSIRRIFFFFKFCFSKGQYRIMCQNRMYKYYKTWNRVLYSLTFIKISIINPCGCHRSTEEKEEIETR